MRRPLETGGSATLAIGEDRKGRGRGRLGLLVGGYRGKDKAEGSAELTGQASQEEAQGH